MIRTKSIKLSIVILSLLTFISASGIVFASNDNYGFTFHLKSKYRNSYSSARYRQTSNEYNKWKVNLKYNSEGNGAIATFWLVRAKSKAVASLTHDVKQGTGAHYYTATAAASRTNVRLAAENNNSSACTVAGYWDEETD
ncbi:MAG: DUF2712 domain-containing protein [Hornefia sp.]|nr:DUF2712 domain-containing protein [Hornefia sp.]